VQYGFWIQLKGKRHCCSYIVPLFIPASNLCSSDQTSPDVLPIQKAFFQSTQHSVKVCNVILKTLEEIQNHPQTHEITTN
jgi:hypothetical protein